MSAWKVQAARITVFPLVGSGSVPKSALELYKAVWGKEPDSYQSQPAAGFPFPNSIAQGVAGTISRFCQTQPIRADFTFGPAGIADPSVMPVIADTDLLRAELEALIEVIGAAFQQTAANRVALYLQIGQEASDYARANRIVSEAIWDNQKVSLTDEEDFVLQINRKRSDQTDASLKLNFITKWSVERVQLMTFLANQMSGSAGVPVMVEKIVPMIALDNSNVPLQKPFANDEIKRLLSQLFSNLSAQLKQCKILIKGF